MSDKELIAAARQPTGSYREALDKIVTEYDMALYTKGETLDRLSRAAVPDAATGELARARDLIDLREFEIDNLHELISELRTERAAALAAIERMRAEADAYAEQPDVMEPCGAVAQALRMALDGAPEPESRWEYRGRLQSCGYVAEGYISAEYAMNGLRVELEDHPYLAMDDTAIVERARVREWLPVEGEKP